MTDLLRKTGLHLIKVSDNSSWSRKGLALKVDSPSRSRGNPRVNHEAWVLLQKRQSISCISVSHDKSVIKFIYMHVKAWRARLPECFHNAGRRGRIGNLRFNSFGILGKSKGYFCSKGKIHIKTSNQEEEDRTRTARWIHCWDPAGTGTVAKPSEPLLHGQIAETDIRYSVVQRKWLCYNSTIYPHAPASLLFPHKSVTSRTLRSNSTPPRLVSWR